MTVTTDLAVVRHGEMGRDLCGHFVVLDDGQLTFAPVHPHPSQTELEFARDLAEEIFPGSQLLWAHCDIERC